MTGHERERLVQFGDQFDLVSRVIEEANRYGTSPQLEERYGKLRSWLLLNYRAVRGSLRPLMPAESTGGDRMLWLGSETDSFERLMSFATLDRAVRQPEPVLTARLAAVKVALERAASGMVTV